MTDEHSAKYCRLASHAVELLRGKWRMHILCVIRSGPVRLGQLARLIPSASKKVLTENLRELKLRGLVIRRDLSGTVRHIEYDFSEAMRPAVTLILDRLADLGAFHLAEHERKDEV